MLHILVTPTHFENKHLSTEHSNRIKVALTDVGAILIWAVSGAWSVWITWRSWRLRLWLIGTTRSHSGKSLSRGIVRRSYKKKKKDVKNLI